MYSMLDLNRLTSIELKRAPLIRVCVQCPRHRIVERSFRHALKIANIVDGTRIWIELAIPLFVGTGCPY